MTELNTVLEGEYKGEKIKKQDNLEIITGDASDKKLVCMRLLMKLIRKPILYGKVF